MKSTRLFVRFFFSQVILLLVLSLAVPGWAAERCVYKFDNVILVFDRSGSMLEAQPGSAQNKFLYAGDIAAGIAGGIPEADEGELFMGLKVFGFHIEDEPLRIRTAVARQKLDREFLVKTIKSFKPPKTLFGYTTPLARSLANLRLEADQWPGRTAVLIISDGHDTSFFGNPVQEARILKEEKSDATIFTALMGKYKKGRKVMQGIASVGGGKFFESSELYNSATRNALLREIFLECTPIVEKPPAPPPPVVKPEPVRPVVTDEMFPVIMFDFDRFSIRASEKTKLEEAANILKNYPDVRVRLEGHADSIGTQTYNQTLSEKRSNRVKQYIQKFFGIAKERLETTGFSETRPTAPNDTKENRQKNRRVEFKIQ